MKSIFTSNSKERDSKVFGIELLSENEMLNVRGGTEPDKPLTKPVDEYDDEDED